MQERSRQPTALQQFHRKVVDALSAPLPPIPAGANINPQGIKFYEPRDLAETYIQDFLEKDENIEAIEEIAAAKRNKRLPATHVFFSEKQHEFTSETEESIISLYNSKNLHCLRNDCFRVQSLRTKKVVNYKKPRNPTITPGELFDPATNVHPMELIFTISFYHSANSTKIQSFQMLGMQTLLQLREMFECTDELPIDANCSNAGFFYIGEKFYIYDEPIPSPDGNLVRSEDLSQPIREWLTRNGKKIPGPDKMSRRIIELDVTIDERYLYCHKGDCEHILVFEGVHQFSPAYHPREKSSYPRLVYECKKSHCRCSVCTIELATTVTWRDPLAPESPAYFCNACYNMLHFDQDNKNLVNHFKIQNVHPISAFLQ